MYSILVTPCRSVPCHVAHGSHLVLHARDCQQGTEGRRRPDKEGFVRASQAGGNPIREEEGKKKEASLAREKAHLKLRGRQVRYKGVRVYIDMLL